MPNIRTDASNSLHKRTIFFLTDTAPTAIYTLSLHDALPIFALRILAVREEPLRYHQMQIVLCPGHRDIEETAFLFDLDRKSTRLNSSHVEISYAVFCLKKKKKRWRSTRTIDPVELAFA